MKILITLLMFVSLCLYAQSPKKDDNLTTLLKGSKPFMCQIGSFKVIKLNSTGAFKKFSLDGSGILINSSGNQGIVASNKEIEYLVPSSNKYIENGKHLSVVCNKSISVGGSPFPIEFYVESK
jgi:hypothetical protein